MRQFIAITCLLFLFISPVSADESAIVGNLIQTNVDKIVALLQNSSIDKTSRNQRIIEIVTPLFDYQAMAKLSLGKKHWPGLSDQQKQQFSDLFINRLQESYLEKLDIYNDEKILYGEPQVEGKKAHAPTTLITKDSRIEILYKFYQSELGWKIYDIEIGGVSVIQTYRSQFDGILNNGTFEDLLKKLQQKESFDATEPDKTRA